MAFTHRSLAALGLFALGAQPIIHLALASHTKNTPLLTKEQVQILSHMSIVQLPDGQGGLRKTLRLTGINVQIVNGLGATNGHRLDPTTTDPLLSSTNGVGNLIIGYDDLPRNPTAPLDRTGSHNLVVGFGHNYSSFGGQVVAYENTTSAAYAVVSGGGANTASAEFATVSGGINNRASGADSSVSGGFQNRATGFVSSVSGGTLNLASAQFSSVSGGQGNVASGDSSTVSGGGFNSAGGFISTVGGGSSRTNTGSFDWNAGSLFEDF